ncbi:MAG: N-acetylmuramoyl-L-alanine amidase [Verrucomicrobiales bacterium]|nr:N-acetylmuramoyl-L-alanine amidase [Verrucomicrobiales bacterium]
MKSIIQNWPLLLIYPVMLIGFIVSVFKSDFLNSTAVKNNSPDSSRPVFETITIIPGGDGKESENRSSSGNVVSEPEGKSSANSNVGRFPFTWGRDGADATGNSKPDPIRSDFSTPKTIHLGANLYAIGNKTHSFTALIDQAAKVKGAAIIDRHFNSYRGKGSGHLMLCNQQGVKLAAALNAEFKKVYDEQGWYYDHPNLIVTNRANTLAVLRLATQKNMAAVIGEFGFIDDRVNREKIGEFIKSKEGQKRIARATIDAAKKVSSIENIVLSAGHHGNRGTGGASYKGFHETEYAFATFEAIREILQNGDSAAYEGADASSAEADEYDGYFFTEAGNIEGNQIATSGKAVEPAPGPQSLDWGYSDDSKKDRASLPKLPPIIGESPVTEPIGPWRKQKGSAGNSGSKSAASSGSKSKSGGS